MKFKITYPDRIVESTNVYLETVAGLEYRNQDITVTPYGCFIFEKDGNSHFIPLLQVRRVGSSGEVFVKPAPHVSAGETYEYHRVSRPTEDEEQEPYRPVKMKRK